MRIVFYGSEPDFLFLSDHFRHLRKSIFSHRQLKYIFCFHLQLLTVLLQESFAACHGREVDVFVMLCTIQISATTCWHGFSGLQSFSDQLYWNPVLFQAFPSSQSQ